MINMWPIAKCNIVPGGESDGGMNQDWDVVGCWIQVGCLLGPQTQAVLVLQRHCEPRQGDRGHLTLDMVGLQLVCVVGCPLHKTPNSASSPTSTKPTNRKKKKRIDRQGKPADDCILARVIIVGQHMA